MMTNTKAFWITAAILLIAFLCWFTAGSAWADSNNIPEWVLYSLMALFGVTGLGVIGKQIIK